MPSPSDRPAGPEALTADAFQRVVGRALELDALGLVPVDRGAEIARDMGVSAEAWDRALREERARQVEEYVRPVRYDGARVPRVALTALATGFTARWLEMHTDLARVLAPVVLGLLFLLIHGHARRETWRHLLWDLPLAFLAMVTGMALAGSWVETWAASPALAFLGTIFSVTMAAVAWVIVQLRRAAQRGRADLPRL